jgi:hypothetical protein
VIAGLRLIETGYSMGSCGGCGSGSFTGDATTPSFFSIAGATATGVLRAICIHGGTGALSDDAGVLTVDKLPVEITVGM